jgi:hypothetical protein
MPFAAGGYGPVVRQEREAVSNCVRRSVLAGMFSLAAVPAFACEPIVPFMQVVAPTLALSGSLLALAAAVLLKSVLFAIFEKRIPRVRAALFMLAGNVLTSVVGLVAAAMIGGAGVWLIGVPIVFVLCWIPARRLITVAPRPWLARRSPGGVAALMTTALVASCFLFMMGQGAILANRLALYWAIKLVAVYLALIASIALTTIWEEWTIWKLTAPAEEMAFFVPVLRSNLYVLVLVMAVAAGLMLPKRLKSPDFLAKRAHATVAQAGVVR